MVQSTMRPVESSANFEGRAHHSFPSQTRHTLADEMARAEPKVFETLVNKTQFIGHTLQPFMPTTEKSKSHHREICLQTHAEVETFKRDFKEQHLKDFMVICSLFGINVSFDATGKMKYNFYSEAQKQEFAAADKNLYKIISRMIESISLIQGYGVGLEFAKFLCKSFTEDEAVVSHNADLRQARDFWKKVWAPHVVRNPVAEFFHPLAAARPVQHMFDLCCDFEEVEELFKNADINMVHWAQEKPASLPPIPNLVSGNQIGSTNIHLGACTSVTAICNFTKIFGVEFGVLNFANAYRVGGGILGFGKVQEEGLFQRTLMFFIALKEIIEGTVVFLPEHRTLGHSLKTVFHEGEYTRQLEYTEERTRQIEGRSENGLIVPNPEELASKFRSVVIKDDQGRELAPQDQTPFISLTAAVSDRSLSAAVASKTPRELAATRDAPGADAPYSERDRAQVRQTLSAVLRTAQAAQLKNLILGAIGCGAFAHSPHEVAQIFNELLNGEFRDQFDNVVFAIPNEHSPNFQAFKGVFVA